MEINGWLVAFKTDDKTNLVVSFGPFQGTLTELLDFRRSFDYECYTFGNGKFTSACWLTIKANDHDCCKYPRIITIKSGDTELTMSWDILNDLITAAKEYLEENGSNLMK